MKTNMIVKLGISMLVMLMTIGTVSASGGASYSQAQSISVPYNDVDIWSGTFTADDWYKFNAASGDFVYVDAQASFLNNGGELKVHDDYEGDIEAWIGGSHNDHYATGLQSSPQPRIEIIAGRQFSYQFSAGLNYW